MSEKTTVTVLRAAISSTLGLETLRLYTVRPCWTARGLADPADGRRPDADPKGRGRRVGARGGRGELRSPGQARGRRGSARRPQAVRCPRLCERADLPLHCERDVDGRAVHADPVVLDERAHRDHIDSVDPAQRLRRLLNGRVGRLGEALGRLADDGDDTFAISAMRSLPIAPV